MISIDWQQLIACLLLGASGLGSIAYGWKRLRMAKPATPSERSADEPAPPGAIEWVEDICTAMGSAPPETMLKALKVGSSRDNARALRVAELEAKP